MTTRTADSQSTTPEPTARRNERYRVRFDSARQAAFCAQIAGASRFVYNLQLAICEWHYEEWLCARESDPEAKRPNTAEFTLNKRFTVIRNRPQEEWFQAFLRSGQGQPYADQDLSWLRDLPYAPVRHAAKYLSGAYTRFYKAAAAARESGKSLGRRKSDGKPKYFPRRKVKNRKPDGFTIPGDVRMDGHRLRVPGTGWVRLDKDNPLYLGCEARQVRVLKEGTEQHPKWYAIVSYQVPAELLAEHARTGALGVDRNVGQATDSEGEVYEVPDDPKLDAHIKRKQRGVEKARRRSRGSGKPMSNRGRRVCGQLKKLQRRKKRWRENANHQASRKLADSAHTVVLEDLDIANMTKSAKGTAEEPGRNVKQKSGLNREILSTGWGQLERNLGYKAGRVVKVDPAYTSQTCSSCGHISKENRRTQATFKCVACGYKANADHNAALNILERGLALLPKARGNGASARRDAFDPWPLPQARAKSTSATREQDMPDDAPGPPGPCAWSGM